MWDQIKTEIFENDQMDIYEKMCLLVLIAIGEDANISTELLARYMGCTMVTARKAFEALKQKGYLSSEGEDMAETVSHAIKAHPNARESKVLSTDEADGASQISKPLLEPTEHFREGFFMEETPVSDADEFTEQSIYHDDFYEEEKQKEAAPIEDDKTRRERLKAYLLGDFGVTGAFKEEAPAISLEKQEKQVSSVVKNVQKPFVSIKSSKESLVDQVINIIEEKISFKEANIILGFAGNDIEKIKRKYRIAKMSQVSDVVGVLINELQKRESNIIKSEDIDEPTEPETVAPQRNSQVNTYRIQKMQAYQKQGKGNK